MDPRTLDSQTAISLRVIGRVLAGFIVGVDVVAVPRRDWFLLAAVEEGELLEEEGTL